MLLCNKTGWRSVWPIPILPGTSIAVAPQGMRAFINRTANVWVSEHNPQPVFAGRVTELPESGLSLRSTSGCRAAGSAMIKAVWFTVVCFVVVAVAAAIGASDAPTPATAQTEATTASEPTTVGTSFAQEILPRAALTREDVANLDVSTQATAGDSTSDGGTSSRDTLTKTDRLDVAPARAAIAAAPPPAVATPPAEPAPVSAAATTSPGATAATAAAVNRRPHHEANAKMIAPPAPTRSSKESAKSTTQARAKTGEKASTSRKDLKVARARTDVKSCRRPDGFAGFLRSLNIGPRCAT